MRITIVMRVSLVAVLALQMASVLAAEDDGSWQSAAPASQSPSQPAPQGPAKIQPIPVAAPGLVGYQPIPESMLPTPAPTATTAPTAQPANVPVPTNLGGPTTTGPYTLGRDDVVYITVQGQPDFTGSYLIGPNGTIQYGFLGDVKADGLTKDELAQVLAEQLKKYVRIPSVSVAIVGFNSKAVYIFGRVARPGKYAMRGDTVKLRDAVIAAGLMVKHAKLRRVHIVKSATIKPTYRVVDLFNVIYRGKMQDDVELVNGDVVVVPTTIWGGITDFISDVFSPASHVARAAAVAAI